MKVELKSQKRFDSLSKLTIQPTTFWNSQCSARAA